MTPDFNRDGFSVLVFQGGVCLHWIHSVMKAYFSSHSHYRKSGITAEVRGICLMSVPKVRMT